MGAAAVEPCIGFEFSTSTDAECCSRWGAAAQAAGRLLYMLVINLPMPLNIRLVGGAQRSWSLRIHGAQPGPICAAPHLVDPDHDLLPDLELHADVLPSLGGHSNQPADQLPLSFTQSPARHQEGGCRSASGAQTMAVCQWETVTLHAHMTVAAYTTVATCLYM